MKNSVNRNFESWNKIVEYLIEMSAKQKCKKNTLTVPADNLKDPRNSRLFKPANLMSLSKDSEVVYRDDTDECSLQVRYYADGDATPMGGKNYNYPIYHIQVDHHNPTEGVDQAIAHLFHDLMGVKLPWEH